jgi:hypothetical protein
MNPLRLAVFETDVTPPLGSPLCAGFVRPAERISDPLRAMGVLLDWGEAPVVLCALDWCELRNDGYQTMTEALAAAVSTSPDRVAVQCVHQHNAPFVDPLAQALAAPHGDLPAIIDQAAVDRAVEDVAAAAKAALPRLRPVTRITAGQAEVNQVASNRRVPGADGTIQTRWSACADDALRAEPEGRIDPILISLIFWGETPNGEPQKLGVLHYYATHPMSYYGDGCVSADFMGLARQRRVEEDGAPHLIFTGCAGDITAGKYNDGAPENRPILADRVHRAMIESERRATEIGPPEAAWRTYAVTLKPRDHPNIETLESVLADSTKSPVERTGAAMEVAYRQWAESHPITLSCLTLGDRFRALHLPGEPFVDYQLYAKSLRPGEIIAVAGYGDGGVGYLPLEQSFAEGGYEPEWAFAEPASEGVLKRAIRTLLG